MNFRVVIPADGQPREHIAKGAAILETGHGLGLVLALPQQPFAEACQQAARGTARRVPLDFPTECVGFYHDSDGELRLNHRGAMLLQNWIGRPVYRNELEARDNRTNRRAQARRAYMQGRPDVAMRLDRRMGF